MVGRTNVLVFGGGGLCGFGWGGWELNHVARVWTHPSRNSFTRKSRRDGRLSGPRWRRSGGKMKPATIKRPGLLGFVYCHEYF